MHPNRRVLLWPVIAVVALTGLVGFALAANRPEPMSSPAVNWLGPIEFSTASDLAGVTAADDSLPAASVSRQEYSADEIEDGRRLLRAYGCGACHTIPGVGDAHAHVGPPLTEWARRRYIAGSLPNTTDNLTRWIVDPQAIEPGTAMPTLGVSEDEARLIGAYLYSLGDTE
jgi:cytochrome c